MHVTRAALVQQAHAALAAGNLAAAQQLGAQLLSRDKNDADALMLMYLVSRRGQGLDAAQGWLERLIEAHPNNPVGFVTLGEFFLRLGRLAEAEAQLKAALRVRSNHTGALSLLARTYDMTGQSEQAQALLAPHVGAPWEDAAIALSYGNLEVDAKRYQNAIDVVSRHVSDAHEQPQLLRELWFVLGKAYERAGEIDQAFEAYRSAHATAPFPFDFADYERRIHQMIGFFSPQMIAGLPRAKHGSELLVLIVSRPRAGSTLVERILGAHAGVHSLGEVEIIPRLAGKLNRGISSAKPYPQCVADMTQEQADNLGRQFVEGLEQLGRGAKRVTIKELRTWAHLGLIEVLSPGARVIDLRRDAVDNCLACYSESLGAILPFQGDLRLLGEAYRLYERMMEHWQRVLGLRILRVEYEELVSDPEEWGRRIVEFVGLRWDRECLALDHNKGVVGSSTAAPTLSYQQVRQPIYKTSVGRAAKFAKHLGPLLEGLGVEE